MKKLILILVSLFTFLPIISIAHEGHGVVNTGPAHYVFTPEHALPLMLVVLVVGYFVGKKILKRI